MIPGSRLSSISFLGKMRTLVFISPLLFAFSLFVLVQNQAVAQMNLDARIGFGQSAMTSSRYRSETWTPITVYLTGQSVRGTGQLSVTVHHGSRNTVYSRRVALNEGPINETYSFAFDYPATNNYNPMSGMSNNAPEVIAQLVLDGREVAKKRFPMPLPVLDDTFNLLALTRDGSGLNFLVKKKMGLVHKGLSPANVMTRYGNAMANQGNGGNGGNTPAKMRASLPAPELLYTDPHALPEMAQGYSMMDAVALGDQPLDTLKEDQISALKAYVREGGLLIISGGGDLSRLKSQFYQEMLPVNLTSAINLKSSPELTALQERYQQRLEIPAGTSLAIGTLKPEASILIGSAKGATGFGAVASRPYGSGIVLFTAFDFLAPEFRGWSKAPSLWNDLLRAGNTAISPRTVLKAASSTQRNGSSLGLADALAGKQASSIPPFPLVAGFLGAYIILLVPISYLILKKMDKREFAWISSPFLILGFTVASYFIALSIKGGALTVNKAVIVEGLANSSIYTGYGQMTLYSPRRADYTIAFTPAGEASKAFRTLVPSEAYANEITPGNLHIEHDQSSILKEVNIPLWDKRSFETPLPVDLGGTISVTTEMINEFATNVTVTNNTKYAIRDCAIINADSQTLPIGTLSPGQTWKSPSTFAWSYKGVGSTIHLPQSDQSLPNDLGKKSESPEELRDHIRRTLTEALNVPQQQQASWNGSEEFASSGHVSNALVGWIDNRNAPLLNVQVDGKVASGQEAALLYLHLPMPKNAPSKVQGVTNPFKLDPDLEVQTEAASPRGGSIPGALSGE